MLENSDVFFNLSLNALIVCFLNIYPEIRLGICPVYGQIASRSPHRSLTQIKDKVIFSEKHIMQSRLFDKENNLRRDIPAFLKVSLAHNYIPTLSQDPD